MVGTATRRILVVGPVPPPMHGVTVMTAALLDALADTDWRVAHVDTSDHRDIDNIGRLDFVNVGLAIRHAACFARELLRNPPNVVYLPLSQGFVGFLRDAVFLMTARLTAAEVVVHAHGGQYREFYLSAPAAVRALMRVPMARVQLAVVLAESQRRQFEGWAPQRTRIEVIPNGVRDEWPDGLPQRPPAESATVLFLGGLMPEKGFLDVLDAVPLILRQAPKTRFVFAGRPAWDEPTAALVDARLHNSGTRDAITFAGAIAPGERRQLLETADLLAFPPRWDEGQGLVALEAMSAGLPIVATASGGLAETVRDGIEAIVVPKCDPEAIAGAVTKLLQDPALRARMGAAARARFESEYTLEHWGSRMFEAFCAAVEGR